VVWCGVVWCGVVWCGVVWCGVGREVSVIMDDGRHGQWTNGRHGRNGQKMDDMDIRVS
jgi:hypothetical protein